MRLGLVAVVAVVGATLVPLTPPPAAAAQTLSVCIEGAPTCDHDNLADAIAAAVDGDTITIAPGSYPATNVTIDVSVAIIGDGTNAPVLDGSGNDTVLTQPAYAAPFNTTRSACW